MSMSHGTLTPVKMLSLQPSVYTSVETTKEAGEIDRVKNQEYVDWGHSLIPQSVAPSTVLWKGPGPSKCVVRTTMVTLNENGQFATEQIVEHVETGHQLVTQKDLQAMLESQWAIKVRRRAEGIFGPKLVHWFDSSFGAAYPAASRIWNVLFRMDWIAFMAWVILSAVVLLIAVLTLRPDHQLRYALETEANFAQVVSTSQSGEQLTSRLTRQSIDAAVVRGKLAMSSLPEKRQLIKLLDIVVADMGGTAEAIEAMTDHVHSMGVALFHKHEGIMERVQDQSKGIGRWMPHAPGELGFEGESELRQRWIDATEAAGSNLDQLMDEADFCGRKLRDLKDELVAMIGLLDIEKAALQRRKDGVEDAAWYRWGLMSDPIPSLERDIAMIEALLPGLDETARYIGSVKRAMTQAKDRFRDFRAAIKLSVLEEVWMEGFYSQKTEASKHLRYLKKALDTPANLGRAKSSTLPATKASSTTTES